MNTVFSLHQKVIVITGATGVLGKGFVQAVAQAGGIPILIGRNEAIGNQRVEELRRQNVEALFIKCDVLNQADLESANALIVNKYGKIDGLVNAAGGNIPESIIQPNESLFDFSIDALKKAMDLNLWGTILPTQIFGKTMASAGLGSIVNISSISAKQALTKVLGYSLGKASVDCFTKWFAVELAKRFGDKIRINSIMPGFFLTEQNRALLTNADGSLTQRGQQILQNTPFNRFGEASELGGALVWLLSDASSFVTGTDISVDGGFNAFSGV